MLNHGAILKAAITAALIVGMQLVDPTGALARQRERPTLNPQRTTFVGDNGELLRGPYTSTEWTNAVPYDEIARIRDLGFNAVHLYAEVFDPRYPAAGSTAPGYNRSEVDKIVEYTRDLGLYLVITIGNGANNGDHNRQWATDFWAFYAPRYADETHVIYEIHNEPVAWGPPYSSPTANPPGALDLNVELYNLIRSHAPETPVLLFSYSVLGEEGGARDALTDIHEFNRRVFGRENAVWTNEAIAFHGYAGPHNAAEAIEILLANGYPCFMTEFGTEPWGGGRHGLDIDGVAYWERMRVSWLTFQYIPPTGVSEAVTRPETFRDLVDHSGLSWRADYGNWPELRSVFGNDGLPWTVPGHRDNTLYRSVRIEAEDFDYGGKGIAYNNRHEENAGGYYRLDETVAIVPTGDIDGDYHVTMLEDGDWIEYTIRTTVPGLYDLSLRVAGSQPGSVSIDALGRDVTGIWSFPSTGGAATWQTITRRVLLGPGQQILRVNVLKGGFNLNWIELAPAPAGPVVDGIYKILNRATGRAIGIGNESRLVTGNYTGAAHQQWTFQHIGGGQYRIRSTDNGQSWNNFGKAPHVTPWWGAGQDQSFIVVPTDSGFFRFLPAGTGKSLQPSTDEAPLLDREVYTGAGEQQWVIIPASVPPFPTGVTATESGSTSAIIRWNAVSGATGYLVQRATSPDGPFTTIAQVTTTSRTDTGLSAGTQYYYRVKAVGSGGESLPSVVVALRSMELRGTIIGTTGSWSNQGNTREKAFDGDLSSFFDSPEGNGSWVGYDFGSGNARVIGRIDYAPRSGFESRMVGGVFQGANLSNWSDAVTLYTITQAPPAGQFTTVEIKEPTAFRYVRYLAPDNGWGNIAELKFYGSAGQSGSAAPAGLTAIPVAERRVHLSWNPVAGATGYVVKRATQSGGPYTTVAADVTTTDYSDTTIAADQTYYYVVHAKTGATEGAASEEAQITPTPWKHVDIGALGAPGNAVFSGGTLRVTASGADIWDTRDEFHFVYRRVSGDCRLVVRVDSVSNSDPWAKAGVMIRRTLLADSQHAMVVVTPGNGVSFQYRSEAGGNMRDVTSGSIRTPRWLSIRRQGNQIVAEQSANGVTWSVIGSQTIAMGEDVYIGIAVTSHNDGTLCEAVISNIQLTGNEPGARNAADAWWLYQ